MSYGDMYLLGVLTVAVFMFLVIVGVGLVVMYLTGYPETVTSFLNPALLPALLIASTVVVNSYLGD